MSTSTMYDLRNTCAIYVGHRLCAQKTENICKLDLLHCDKVYLHDCPYARDICPEVDMTGKHIQMGWDGLSRCLQKKIIIEKGTILQKKEGKRKKRETILPYVQEHVLMTISSVPLTLLLLGVLCAHK
ncbi:hypothetical protein BCR43DRAFT_262259 [Syncephalastrum racemosum]|uniref:Uncharacterized protein n=1 Tax=Syncephalastrum racemosum TaxID=13706 RepID=A0A1X2HGP3_SYNRA|nr:hypothetical protein BCR43DRAFT_262259 [Syncephalastrum racemosum]